MPCSHFSIRDPKTGQVITGFVRHGKPRPRVCVHCKRPIADLLCDGPPATPLLSGLEDPRASETPHLVPVEQPTCSRPICKYCAIRLSDGRDFCKREACRAAAESAALELKVRAGLTALDSPFPQEPEPK